jgi:galactokinase
MDLTNLKDLFQDIYQNNSEIPSVFFAPGRVNLIGEHTDYNGGYVFPCAISFGTYLIIRANQEKVVRLATTNFSYKAEIALSELHKKHGNEWVNYPLGVFDQFTKRGFTVKGFDLLFSGNIPNGAGLSSSASIEMVTAVALDSLLETMLSKIELIKIGRAAENEFVGMNCGIMDQFAIGMGKKESALALNCRSLEYQHVPLRLGDYKIVIANTNKRRELADSKYNERVAECAVALENLRQVKPMVDLSSMNMDEFKKHSHLIADETIRKRAYHVISENNRVIEAVAALIGEDLVTFGKLMNQSHISLKEDYEVTGFELDTIVNEAWQMDGVLGARMTGAGFGGCSVNIVKQDQIDDFIRQVGENYTKKTGLVAEFYVASVGNGACKLELF